MQTQSACLCPAAQTNNTSNAAQSSESFSVVISQVSISSYYNPWNGTEMSPEQAQAMNTNSMPAILQNLPNVRHYMKPWYFSDAQNQNISYLRTVAIRIVSNYKESTPEQMETVFSALKEKNGVTETNNCCHSNSSPNTSNTTQPSDLLTAKDKCQLEDLHHYAEEKHIDTNHVNTIATKLAIDKSKAVNNQDSQPALTKDYFEESIASMGFWKNNIHGEQIIDRLREFFA